MTEEQLNKLNYDKDIPANKGDITLQGKLILADKDGNFIDKTWNGSDWK